MSAPPLPVTLKLYRYGLYLGEPAVAAYLARRARRGKEEVARLAERRGVPGRSRPEGRLAWMHGASIGEALSLIGLAEGLVARGLHVLVTTGTRSAAELLRTRLPAGAFHQYVPLDAPRWVNRFLDHWRPDLALVAESEIWPNIVIALHARGVPLVLVNGRMSQRSLEGWRRAPGTARALFTRVATCLAQTEADAERFSALGTERARVTGNLKYDSETPPADPAQIAAFRAATGDRPVWVAASTHPGEDEPVLAAHSAVAPHVPGLLSVIVPRHPHRGPEIAARAAARGLSACRRSDGREPEAGTEVYIADSLGELGLFYRLSPLVFLGGSLVPHGGQNPIEPVRCDAAILHGPHVGNFAEPYGALDAEGGALALGDAEALRLTLGTLLAAPARMAEMAVRAKAALRRFEGARERTLAEIEPFIARLGSGRG